MRWSACQLTGQPLSQGRVVADLLGSLFLHDAAMEFLLARVGTFLDDDSEVGPRLAVFRVRQAHVLGSHWQGLG